MNNLAPEIYRQRAVIEGYPSTPLSATQIVRYLRELSHVLGMRLLNEPVTNRSPKFGEAGWVHWESSGAHFYAWDVPRLFFSVDIYTCSPFDLAEAVAFTKRFFGIGQVEFQGY